LENPQVTEEIKQKVLATQGHGLAPQGNGGIDSSLDALSADTGSGSDE
jgi:hypothetical protein